MGGRDLCSCGAIKDLVNGEMMCPMCDIDFNSCEIQRSARSELSLAIDTQVGGDHYKTCKIQPAQYAEANGLKYLEGCILKRITRHDKPTGKGRQDIEKVIHEAQLLLELRYGESNDTP